MSWDFRIDPETNDLTGGTTTGQDEILQRLRTRLFRLLGEWFCNTSAGLPWYEGWSTIIDGEFSRDTGMLGSRDFARVNIVVRNEIIETDGVIELIDFNGVFDAATREYTIRAKITTNYGLAYLRISQPA